jgi:MraZ protein
MFLGQHEHSLDDKNRITLPARFRGPLEHGVVITRGLDRCLWVYTLDEWDKVADKIDGPAWTQRGSRAFSRLMFSGAVDVTPDRQGRIRIPDYLLKYAGITSDVVIVGLRSKIEIWARDQWVEIEAILEEDPEGIAEQFDSLGIK